MRSVNPFGAGLSCNAFLPEDPRDMLNRGWDEMLAKILRLREAAELLQLKDGSEDDETLALHSRLALV